MTLTERWMTGGVLAGLLMATLTAAQAPSAAVTAFEGARIITGDGSAPIESGVFLVEGTRLTQVGRAGEVKVPANARRVSLAGKTVIPGIIDAHTHPGDTRETVARQLQQKAYYGSVAVLSLGLDAGDLAFTVRGTPIDDAARLRTAGRGITTPEPGRSEVPYWVKSPGEARTAVQELAGRQADFVKIWVDDRNGKYQRMTPPIYQAVIDEAHKHGLRVAAHIYYLEDAKGLLRAGLDAFAHGVRDTDVDDEFVALVRERPTVVLVPNLPDRGVATSIEWLRSSLPADEFKKLAAASGDRPAAQPSFAIQARNLARLNAAGMTIALGTDGFVPWSHHVEMEDMVAAGMTPAQVIVAATRNAATLAGFTDLGLIAAGKSADFVVLDANPLDDITNTRRISAVYTRGAALDRDAMRARW